MKGDMSAIGCKRVAFVLSVASVVQLLCLCCLGLMWNRQRIEARTVWSVMADFERSRERLGRNTIDDDVAILDIVTHAHSNLKDPHLNLILAKETARMAADIIKDLRSKTGEDLGSDPERWISERRRISELVH